MKTGRLSCDTDWTISSMEHINKTGLAGEKLLAIVNEVFSQAEMFEKIPDLLEGFLKKIMKRSQAIFYNNGNLEVLRCVEGAVSKMPSPL
jgi:hypothetical protein